MSFFQRYKRFIPQFLAVLTLLHFLFFLLKPKERLDTAEWEKQTCLLSESREIVDLDCRYYHTKKWIFAQPVLSYGEPLVCHQLKTARGAELYAQPRESSCGEPKFWGRPQKMAEIGWDAYSIWWGRAAVLYQRSKISDWPGLGPALVDPKIIRAFPNKEHHHYPWLVSLIYFGVMKIVDSANPYVLQWLQFGLWAVSVFLFWATWRTAPRYLLIVFAFVPTSAIFMTRLYADLWMVVWGLLMIVGFQRRWWWLLVLSSLFMAFTKQEAVLQGPILLFALFSVLPKNQVPRGAIVSLMCSLFCLFFGFLFYSAFKSDFYVSLASRLQDFGTLKLFFRSVLPYYLDVLFRPALWGALWPLSFYLFYRDRHNLGWRLLFPAIVLVAIPVAYLSFPFGFKEVVLTGSGRALWQTLPLIWFLLSIGLGTANPVHKS